MQRKFVPCPSVLNRFRLAGRFILASFKRNADETRDGFRMNLNGFDSRGGESARVKGFDGN